MNFLKFIIIGFFILIAFSCKDKSDENNFQPSLQYEEYVLLKWDGYERLFLSDRYINAIENQDVNGLPLLSISLVPSDDTFTNFLINIKNPSENIFDKEVASINYLDYSLDDLFPLINLRCSDIQCFGEFTVTMHEYGEVGEEIMGEISCSLATVEDGDELSVVGEFVVIRDE